MNILVSAYYKIPSKQPHAFYMGHLIRWMRSMRGIPIFFYTTADVVEELQRYVDVSHVQFQYVNFTDLPVWKKFDMDFWKRQKERDCERYHTAELAAMWFQKKEFVLRTIQLLQDTGIENNATYIWCDAGCIRNDVSEYAARGFARRNSVNLCDGRLHIQQINTIPYKKYYTYPDYCIAGAIMAGNSDAWASFSDAYERVLRDYDSAGVCGNMDQYIILSCRDSYPDLFHSHYAPTNSPIDPWFFFLGLL